MPVASPAQPPETPVELRPEIKSFIKQAAENVFGGDVVVRHYGTDSTWRIHVEIESCAGLDREAFIGILLTQANHFPHVEITKRGSKPKGDAKIAYRQGVIL
ncbi:hypothetical protein [Novosphingobium jiangmenense]|uniref:Uncharacterized protein n=1 Tax=Novosphingobium jiangmenense TaxID=2791981 RepID=A0ABS0HES6_9SPHN|nr:hypothetical protein [Novosphingobium jiangmenense]MBF9150760.1 hypothetical protein [Novosphingobium jiangmenense]